MSRIPAVPLSPRVALAAAALGLCGCAWYSDTFTRLPTTAEDLRRIEPLDPTALPRQPTVPADAPPPAAPPPQVTLTAEECRAAAIGNNLNIQAVLIDPAIAAARVDEEEARFEAMFRSSASLSAAHTPTSTEADAGVRTRTSETVAGVEMPLRTGGTLTFDLADRETRTNPGSGAVNPAYEPSATVSLSQPLLRNAGRRANTHAIRLARLGEQATQAATRLEVIRVLTAVDRVYWRLYASRRVI